MRMCHARYLRNGHNSSREIMPNECAPHCGKIIKQLLESLNLSQQITREDLLDLIYKELVVPYGQKTMNAVEPLMHAWIRGEIRELTPTI